MPPRAVHRPRAPTPAALPAATAAAHAALNILHAAAAAGRPAVAAGSAGAGPSGARATAPLAPAPLAALRTGAARKSPVTAPAPAPVPSPAPAPGATDYYPDEDELEDCELDEEHDDGEDGGGNTEDAGWVANDRYQFSQRGNDTPDRKFSPSINFRDGNARKSMFEYGKHFLPMSYVQELAEKMQARGRAKYDHAAGSGDVHYKNWTVTVDDVLQWIGCWLYMLAFHQPGGREQYFSDKPKNGFGPTYDLKAWLKVGCPTADHGVRWFKNMHTCFELPTYGRPDDEFNKTRKFWDCLRDAFYAAVTCSWIMCLDESMIKWLGRGMPGFMHVQRKPTPKGLELHTLCCAMCGIMLFFEVYEGKKAMEKKALCDEQKRKLGAKGPWKSVALTLRMVERFKEGGRVLIADSWFGSVACTLALYSEGIFAVMNVKTGHKDYPKDQLLGKLGYDKATKLCPKERRGEWFAFTRKFNTGPGQHCIILAAGHNSKKPVLVVSTAGTATPADDYTKTWTWTNAVGELVKYTIQVPTSIVHSLYHRFFHIVDVHNHLRQGLVSMADVWGTNHWADRHFAEGLGFWEVNVYKALQYFHPSAEYKTLAVTATSANSSHTPFLLSARPSLVRTVMERTAMEAQLSACITRCSALTTTSTRSISAAFAPRAFLATSTARRASQTADRPMPSATPLARASLIATRSTVQA